MAEWRYEIETTVDAIVYDVSSIQTTFVSQKPFVLLINILQYCTKAVRIVNCVTETRCVDNGKT